MSIPPYGTAAPQSRRSTSPSHFLYDGYGWSCPYCINTPYHLRAPGSYYHSRVPPLTKDVEHHLSLCQSPESSDPPWRYEPCPSPYYSPPGYQPPYPVHSSSYHSSQQASTPPPPPPRWYSDSCTNDDYHYYPPTRTYGPPPDYRCMSYPPSSDAQQPYYQYCHQAQPATNPAHLSTATPYASHQAAVKLLSSFEEENSDFSEEPLVLPEDKLLLTDYFYYVNKQLKRCHFTDEDRKTKGGKRESIEVGFAGLECIHCAVNVSGSRKFFWSDANRLANSFSEITRHLQKCRLCPADVKQALKDLKQLHPEQMAKLPRGSQTEFLRKMWKRLHHQKKESTVFSPAGISELDSIHEGDVSTRKKRRL